MNEQNAIGNKEENTFLTTKLFIPRSNAKQVVRPVLIDKLNAFHDPFHDHKMTLVSAPAGYGKTTMLTQWVAQFHDPVAWLSLDAKDNDPFVFLQYFISALQSVDASIGISAENVLQTTKKLSLTAILNILLNDISASQMKFSVVLDDYHCIQTHEVHEILRYILDHMPPLLHLILSTRADPPLPLAKMRARNNLSEIRINLLCFNREVIHSFLNEIMKLNLSEQQIATLEHRTEGWAAGLQLAAISLKGCDNIPAFIEAFSGDNRYIVDYLVEEVLHNQDELTHDFLLKTSFLPQMSADLCDYILEIDNSQTILENLEQQNLFIIPLDSNRNWYRYHHLFADLLFQRLVSTDTTALSELRSRSSRWHKNNGFLDQAIDYAVAAGDVSRAGELISIFAKDVWEHGKRTRLFHWFASLPVEYIRNNSDLCFLHAWVLFENGQFIEAEQSLVNAERLIDSPIKTKDDRGTIDQDNLREIRGKVKAVRALMATGQGDAQRIIDYANEALEYLPAESSNWRAIACFSLGLAHGIDGDNAYAVEVFSQARDDSRSSGNMDLYFRASYWLIGRLKYIGKLQDAVDTCRDLLRYAEEKRLENTLVWGGACVFWGDLLYELNQLDEAYQFINKEIDMIERGHDVGRKGWGYYCLMRLLEAKGDLEGTQNIIAKVEELQRSASMPGWVTQLTESFKAQMWLKQGNLKKVEEWLDQNKIHAAGSILSLQYLGYMILARFLFAQGRHGEAKEVLERLISKQQKTGRTLLQIETLLIQSMVLKSEDNLQGAILSVVEALKLAESGGYIRVFLNEGQPLAELLEIVPINEVNVSQAFVKKLRTAFLVNTVPIKETEEKNSEDLSERELEVLRLIAAGLSNKKIMENLYISLSTVKTHLRNIYSKLDAHSRTEAVAKANELNLL